MSAEQRCGTCLRWVAGSHKHKWCDYLGLDGPTKKNPYVFHITGLDGGQNCPGWQPLQTQEPTA